MKTSTVLALAVVPILLGGGAGALAQPASPRAATDGVSFHDALSAPAARTQPIIIDHTTTDLDQVPVHWLEQAKALHRASYGHTSHGSQLVSGMAALMADPAWDNLLVFNRDGAVQAGVLSLADNTPSGDLGNPDRTSWADRTRVYLNGPAGDRNVVMWSWCGQVTSARWPTSTPI